MREVDALEVLGLEPGADLDAIRRRYRAAIREVHPDVSGSDHEAAALLNRAFTTLRDAARRGELPRSIPPPSPGPAVDDAFVLVAPADEVFDRLYHALDLLGSVTYADRDGGYLEALVPSRDGPPSQLVVTLQGRGHGTEASFTLDSLDARSAPPIDGVVRQIARLVRGHT